MGLVEREQKEKKTRRKARLTERGWIAHRKRRQSSQEEDGDLTGRGRIALGPRDQRKEPEFHSTYSEKSFGLCT